MLLTEKDDLALKVLIIEDEKAMSDLITIKFKVEGFDVEQAFTLSEAREKLSTHGPFDLILADYLLPDGDLIEFLESIQSETASSGRKLLVMTNYIEDVNIGRLRSLGVPEVIVKYQVVPAQIVEKAKQVLGVANNTANPAAATQA